MGKMKFSFCKIPLFKRHVLCVVGCDAVTALQVFKNFCIEQKTTPPEIEISYRADGWCAESFGDFYIWVEKEQYSILFHEIVHAAFGLCDLVGMSADEEIIARLVEHMKLELVDKLEEIDTPSGTH